MPLATFNPPMRPSPGTSHAPTISLRKAAFGDGYTQASPAGLNHIRRVVNFRWDFLTLAEANEIEAFLIQHGGFRPFLYTLNGEATPRKWTCDTWSLTDNHPTQVTATFREDFSLGS